jgi:hypothetical protein
MRLFLIPAVPYKELHPSRIPYTNTPIIFLLAIRIGYEVFFKKNEFLVIWVKEKRPNTASKDHKSSENRRV